MTRSLSVLLQGTCIISSLVFLVNCNNPEKNKNGNPNAWTAPESAKDLKNPLRDDTNAIAKGRELYKLNCWQCHGESGYGDGAAGGALGQQPANFHSPRVTRQEDGELFWKLSNGKGNMPPFKDVLKDEERWALINYIRKISDREFRPGPPKALRGDISVEHVMTTDSLAVRILQHPITKDIYYTTFDGNVFQVKNFNTKQASEKKILTAADHGITRLQGAEFVRGQLFLSGNVDDTAKKATGGRLVKFDIDTAGARNMTVVFNTVMYGTNKTIYDHGWNALAASPDGKYIYINSGARTDHGEVQDNGGLYPGARDNALTSKVFRIPTDAKDLLLTDSLQWLKQNGYIYCEGIRNAYDMAFDGSGHLFAVSNSSDYDNPEDMFWIRQNHHYGFPWIMGGIENPQQYKDWEPDPKTDKFINEFSHSWRVKYFHTDSTFPKVPDSVKFTPGVQNLGPDANEYRGHSGNVLDGDVTGVPVSTFTPHSSPLGLFFDNGKVLSDEFKGDGFVIRYTLGARGNMMRRFTMQGSDLLHLKLAYDAATDNFFVKTTRLVDSFVEPVDAIMIGSDVFVIEYGGKQGNIWKISLPTNSKKIRK